MAKKTLSASEKRAAAFFLAPLPLIVANKGGEVLEMNQAAEAAFKKPKVQLEPLISKLLAHHVEENSAASEIQDGEGKRTYEVRLTELEPDAVLLTLVDLSERRKAQARELQLSTQYLRAQRMESLGMLASGVAHDLNNILSPILMSAPLLRFDLTRHELETTLETIESSASRAAEIVRQLLTFGRGTNVEKVRIQPKHMVKDMVRIARETYPKNIVMRSEVDRDLSPIIGDPTQLHQVLMNLCLNARDSMLDHGGTITLNAKNVDLDEQFASMYEGARSGPHVELLVQDTGHGIPADILDKIFEPFFSTKAPDKGTGLGLPTVKEIVTRHGGFLRVSSRAGEGTSFRVYLPATTDGGAVAEHVTEQAPLKKGRGELVLIVDDEEQILKVTKKTLEANGYTVEVATDGAEAMVTVAQRTGEIKVVITDLLMPFMDGVAFTRAVKRIDPKLIVIASTGQHLDNRMQLLGEAGATLCLNKPYSAEQLLSVLADALKNQG